MNLAPFATFLLFIWAVGAPILTAYIVHFQLYTLSFDPKDWATYWFTPIGFLVGVVAAVLAYQNWRINHKNQLISTKLKMLEALIPRYEKKEEYAREALGPLTRAEGEVTSSKESLRQAEDLNRTRGNIEIHAGLKLRIASAEFTHVNAAREYSRRSQIVEVLQTEAKRLIEAIEAAGPDKNLTYYRIVFDLPKN